MITRGYTILSQRINFLYDKVLEACIKLNASHLHADKTKYKIGWEKGTFFVINLLEMPSGTLLEAVHYKKYDFDIYCTVIWSYS